MTAAATKYSNLPFSLPAFAIALAAFLTMIASIIIYTGMGDRKPEILADSRISLAEMPDAAPVKPVVTEASPKAEAKGNGQIVLGDQDQKPVMDPPPPSTPFQAYALPFQKSAEAKALVAVVVTDIGLAQKLSSEILNSLPPTVSVAIRPGTADEKGWAEKSHKSGHEIWLDLPLQPADYPARDPGAMMVAAKATAGETKSQLLKNLTAFSGYAGVLMPDSTGFHSENRLSDMINVIAEHGLAIALADPKDQTGMATAKSKKVLNGGATFALQEPLETRELEDRLKALEATALAQKQAMIVIRPYPANMRILADWFKSLGAKQIQLVPLSAVMSHE